MQRIIKKTTESLAPSLVANRLRSKVNIDTGKANDFRFKIAEGKEEFEDACRLVHDQYVRKGYMEKRKSGMRLSLFHALPETTTFIGKKEEAVVHTLTLFQDSPLGLPMDSIYKEELDKLRTQGRKIAEVGALAAHPDIQNDDQTALMHGNKILRSYGRTHLGVDDLVMAINPKHRWFYEHVMLCEKIGDLTHYDYVKKAPAVAYRLDLRSMEANFRAVYQGNPPEKDLHRFFFKEQSRCIELPGENQALCFWDREKIRYFFEEKTTLFYKADKKSREVLRRQYPFKIGSHWGHGDTSARTQKIHRESDLFCPVLEKACYLPAA